MTQKFFFRKTPLAKYNFKNSMCVYVCVCVCVCGWVCECEGGGQVSRTPETSSILFETLTNDDMQDDASDMLRFLLKY